MPTQGLSLVGFMDQAQALEHLSTACVPANPAPAALLVEWNAARAQLAAPFANAGQPAIQPIAAAGTAYIQQLAQVQWVAEALATHPSLQGCSFQMVEIDPLLAFQFTVDMARSAQHCAPMSSPPTLDQLLACCLPMTRPSGEYHWQALQQSVVIKSRSLNLQMGPRGIGADFAGFNFVWSLPMVHVVRYNGRCYLHNGFHRTVGARMAGATAIPCVFRDVPTPEAAGVKTDGSTFPIALLESANPPTVGHFTQGRAYNVSLRATTRILHISWAEYAMYDE